ncbi:MAG: hypothetical protein CL840_08890 [Crocinitomicaceae bacterium]|nr:hypothetical protein [Crocinitomicaceae bacterium]|tara:strand:- start:73413 stop:73958 length:546 start_codon:yes stop_codon:yes gene_type:complete
MNSSLANQIIELADSSFGKNYLTKNELQYYSHDPNSKLVIESNNDELIGFSVLQILKTDELKQELYADPEWVNQEFGNYSNIGYRKMTAVVDEHRSKGIARCLFDLGEAWLKEKVDVIVSAAWTKNDETPFSPLLESKGFVHLKTVRNYWKEDSLKRGFICPVCGDPPCLCDAKIYSLKFQ